MWSRGAHRSDGGRTDIELGVEVRNRGDRPVQLARDDLRLEAFGRRGAPLPAPGLSAIHRTPAGPLSVEPGQAATVHLDFAMPAGMDPDRIGALRLRWALLYDDGRRYAYYRVPVGRVIIIDRDRPRRPRR